MAQAMYWFDMKGREAEVQGGPYTGMTGTIQDVGGGKITLGYLDKNKRPRTIIVEQAMVKMPLRDGEVYGMA